MTDRPIIMTPENVRLLVREAEQPGTGKRETRRLLYIASTGAEESTLVDGHRPHASAPSGAHWRPSGWHRCEPGDRIWVREACRNWTNGDTWRRRWLRIADDSECQTINTKDKPGRRASFHMPRVDSRLTLIVERVHIERLQDISGADAKAEGVLGLEWGNEFDYDGPPDYRSGYRQLWESLHETPNSWSDNPWVVAISFRPVLGNIDQLEVLHAAK